MFTYSEDTFSDLYKDVYGFRPRCHEFYDAVPERKQEIWDSLCDELEEEIARQNDAYARAEIAFHQRIQGAMLVGAKDEMTAIRWIIEGEELTEYDLAYGSDYVAFHFGLPYKGEFDQQIQTVINGMIKEAA